MTIAAAATSTTTTKRIGRIQLGESFDEVRGRHKPRMHEEYNARELTLFIAGRVDVFAATFSCRLLCKNQQQNRKLCSTL
jgi:hypothetical protein